jgi:2-dehydro-3-deoxyphosphogluconate aldolase/(4S)-4-hydroxy-2-oxoglutarate aldolase
LSAIKTLFADLQFMPTGGVDVSEDNLKGWFNAGVCAVGMGSKLVSKPLLEKQAYGEITALTRKAMQMIDQIRQKS